MQRLAMVMALAALATAPAAYAHCDGLDGPVVKSAQRALDTKNVNYALAWVRQQDEAAVRRAFRSAVAARGESADRRFFENLVKLHRAGEGEPFTGLKPAGRDLGPAIPAADRAIETGSAGELIALLQHAIEHGVTERFEAARARAGYGDDVAAGREYVKAYVELLHYVERLAHGH